MTDPDGKLELEKPELVGAGDAGEEQPARGSREAVLAMMEKHRRLCALQLLANVPESWVDIGVLRSALMDSGQAVRPDRLASMADWLAAAGLVESGGESSRMLRLTEEGLAVSRGRIRVPGVAWTEAG